MANHSSRTAANIDRVIRRHIYAAGYTKKDVDLGLAYAKSQGDYTAREGYILAMSRILLSEDQLQRGIRFAVEEGCGPR